MSTPARTCACLTVCGISYSMNQEALHDDVPWHTVGSRGSNARHWRKVPDVGGLKKERIGDRLARSKNRFGLSFESFLLIHIDIAELLNWNAIEKMKLYLQCANY